jgi:hypothetical protein
VRPEPIRVLGEPRRRRSTSPEVRAALVVVLVLAAIGLATVLALLVVALIETARALG